MKHHLLFFLLLIGITACTSPTELTLKENIKQADKFTRLFIDKIISGQVESALANLDSEIINDQSKEFIKNSGENLKGAILKKYRIVEENSTIFYHSSKGKFVNYQLAYEYEFKNGKSILFLTKLIEKEGKFTVFAFDGQVLDAPLSELTRFSFENKPVLNYVFLLFSVFIPIFIIITFVFMLKSKILKKRKILWSFLILLLCFPSFLVNWNTGLEEFKMFNFIFMGSGIGRPNLYSPWILKFTIPIGSLLFWFRRENLLREFEQESGEFNNE